MYSHSSRGLLHDEVKEKSINVRCLPSCMIDPPLPRIAEYRFRLRADDTQRCFALPPYLLRREIVSFYLRQEPSDRAAYDCGHAIHVLAGSDGELVFNVGGIADWEHEGRAHDFVEPVREAAS